MGFENTIRFQAIVTLSKVLLLVFQSISALQTVPVVDDLLGPGQCPTGSFCVDTNYCTHEYYATKSGMPFYCGPHRQIDSMICCISTSGENIVIRRKNPVPAPTEDGNGLGDYKISNGSSVDDQDDDEVNIISIPYPVNQNDDLTVDKLLSMMEDVGDHEINSRQQGSDYQSDMEQPITQTEPEQVVTTEVPISYSPEKDYEPTTADVAAETFPSNVNEILYNDLGNDEILPIEPRASFHPETYRPMAPCQCEKGEKGDPGPQGEPGEPGKIVYIPVFVNGGGFNSMPPATYPNGYAFVPGTPPQNQYLFGQYASGLGAQPYIHHPNPVVIPFTVPTTQVPGMPVIQQQHQHQPPPFKYGNPNPIPPSQNQQQPPQGQPPVSQPLQLEPSADIHLFEELQERLQRHSQRRKQR